MMVRWMSNPVYVVCDWFVKLAYLNFLWVIFTLAGGIILGIFPSTAALFAILSRMVRGDTANEILPTFAGTFKNEFKRSNKYGVFFWAFAGIIALNVMLLPQFEGMMLTIVISGVIFTLFLYLIVLFFFFPAYVSMPESSFGKLLTVALFLPFSQIKAAVVVTLGILALLTLFYFFPVLITFWGVSSFAVLFMYTAQKLFEPKQSYIFSEEGMS